MTGCCVPNCNTHSEHSEISTRKLRYIPRPKREEWAPLIRPNDPTWVINDGTRICELHFEDYCFQTKVNKSGDDFRKFFSKNAKPTKFLPRPRDDIQAEQLSNSVNEAEQATPSPTEQSPNGTNGAPEAEQVTNSPAEQHPTGTNDAPEAEEETDRPADQPINQ